MTQEERWITLILDSMDPSDTVELLSRLMGRENMRQALLMSRLQAQHQQPGLPQHGETGSIDQQFTMKGW